MTLPTAEREAQAERLRDFFDLQLRFARHMAARTGASIAESVIKHTNLHQRFGLGDPDAAVSPGWDRFISRLVQLQDDHERLAWTQLFYIASPAETLSPDHRYFGCFRCDAPDDEGVVRIHFKSPGDGKVSPLDRSAADLRRRELAALFADVRQRYPGAVSVKGASWLYHLKAYRRLFPADYGASRVPALRARLCGMSSWGQFLDWRGGVKLALRDAFLSNLNHVDIEAPWRSFPLPVLTTTAPIQSFFEFYRVG